MECNRETILDGLHDFEKRSNNISPILEEYLLKVAKTGDTMFPWIKLKPLLKRKLELVLTEFYETCPMDDLPPLPNVEIFKFDVLKTKLLDALESFQSAPFTIQRMCELLTDPKKHYKRADKFMRGLEKNVLVVSTIEPKSSLQIDINSNSPPFMVNGLISVSPDHLQPSNLLRDNDSLDPEIGESLKINNCHTPLDNFASAFASAPSILTTTEVRELVSEKYVTAHCTEVANCNDECDAVTSVSTSHLAVGTMDTSPDPSEINEDSAYSSDQRNSSPDDTSNYSVTDCAEYVYQSSPEEIPTSEISTTQQEILGSPDVSEYTTESCTLPIDSDEENYIHESSEIDNCDEETSEATEKIDETNYEISSSEVEESDVISNNSTSILVDNNILNHSSGGLPDLFVSSQLSQENSSSTLSLASDIVKEVCTSGLSEHNIVTGILSGEHKIATELAPSDHGISTEIGPSEHDITTEIDEHDVATAIGASQQVITTSEHHIKTHIRPSEHDIATEIRSNEQNITTEIVHSNEYDVGSNVIETEVMDQDLN